MTTTAYVRIVTALALLVPGAASSLCAQESQRPVPLDVAAAESPSLPSADASPQGVLRDSSSPDTRPDVTPSRGDQRHMARPPSGADGTPDRDAVHAAVLDYVDALYLVDPSRIQRSVHPSLAKRGFWRQHAADEYEELEMSFDELYELAGIWNRDGRVDAGTAVKEIVVFDVLDHTASARLTAEWGTDYLHLAKYDGSWKIINVLWQSPSALAPQP